MNCAACFEITGNPSDLLVCNSGCKANFHLTCAGQNDKSRSGRLTPALKKKWICVAFSGTKTKIPSVISSCLPQSSSTKISAMFEELLKNQMEVLTGKLDEFKESMNFNSLLIQELKDTITSLKEVNNNLHR
ncbi:hypothetical protein JTE90_003950 [Oedothorax gibbosus]|uniref:Zinc finger PHD-type domain-containing protein n=1 Tax=Oedothorax gibbosus TaxID=931172 RepID=A0AAV6UYE6_9ARAC|nr:hypothetical protein JTE90_003950 [Oedothorax gibbosus]